MITVHRSFRLVVLEVSELKVDSDIDLLEFLQEPEVIYCTSYK